MRPRKNKKVSSDLKAKGFRTTPRGGKRQDHEYLHFYHGNIKTDIFTFVSHGTKMVSREILKQMATQVHLENNEFEQLLDCPISYQQYIELMIEREYIDV